MGDARPPGPMCIDTRGDWIDDGTLVLAQSRPGGVTGLESADASVFDLHDALRQLEVQAAQFGTRFIQDSAVRLEYLAEIRRYSNEILEAVRRGEISVHDGHVLAHEMRGTLLDASRLKNTDIGRAYAEGLKASNPSLADLYAKYAQKLYGKSFDALTDAERNAVKLEIIESAGRNRPGPTRTAGRLSKLGRGLWVLTIGIAVYNVASAEDKVEATAREGATLGGGIAGGALAGAATGLVCGPGAVVCSSVLVIAGGALGALGMDYVFDWIWE